jgi:hypothetical protein
VGAWRDLQPDLTILAVLGAGEGMQTRAAEVGKGLARNSSHGSDFGD